MSAGLLDINDCGLHLWQDGERILTSPGYALLDGNRYHFGPFAQGRARLQPRNINHRYWWQLSTAPLQPGFGPCRHSADLVHAHLEAVLEQGGGHRELLLAAPGSMQSEQLALLLGIIEQCDFTLAGLVDRAVAAVAGAVHQGSAWFLELQLHQATLTRLQVLDGQLQRHSVTPIPGAGWLALQDSLGDAIAGAFISQTRFDPRRKAGSEQALYDQLPELLGRLQATGEDNLELSGHQARLDWSSLVESCREHCRRLAGSLPEASAQVFLDYRLALLPGLAQALPDARLLGIEAIHQGVMRCENEIRCEPDHVVFTTSLPAGEAPTELVSAGAASAREAPIVDAPAGENSRYRIEFQDGEYTLYPGGGEPPLVNGKPVTAALPLHGGDRLQANGAPLLILQEVVPGNGPQT
ncbi:MAG: hypothetical protein OXC05_12710 [Halieaceae bacterium]|nr:hypothetical protein [Halieaceae bacterium]